MTGAHWDAVFDEDYLYFYETFLHDERNEKEAELIARLLDLGPGADVLDVPCGHGRIAVRLARRGCRVTGLDASPLFLERARQAAAAAGGPYDRPMPSASSSSAAPAAQEIAGPPAAAPPIAGPPAAAAPAVHPGADDRQLRRLQRGEIARGNKMPPPNVE